MASKEISRGGPGLIAAVTLAVAFLANIFLTGIGGRWGLTAWIITILAILLLCSCIGKAISGSWTGVIESARNCVSLSRLQMLVWMTLVLSAVLTAGAVNFHLDPAMGALAIQIPQNLLIAMGISATSLVAAPAVLSLKAVPEADGAAAAARGVSAGIHRRARSESASWLDLFRGDEEGNCGTPDLSKIQQFLITLGLVALYAALLGQMFLTGEHVDALPSLDQNFLWLMGISHAGYLTYKAVPHPASGVDAPAPTTTSETSSDDAVG